MNNFIINNNAGLVPEERNLSEIFKAKINDSLANNEPLSILILCNFNFFEGFKKIYSDIYDLYRRDLLKELKIILGSKSSLIVKDLLGELKKDATSIDSVMFSAIKTLVDSRILDIRIYNEKKVNIKMYVFQTENNVGIYSGSTGLTGQPDELEFLIPVNLAAEDSGSYLSMFDELWAISHDKLNYVKPLDIIRITANENSFCLSQKDFISYMIKLLGKEYLVKNIGFDLSDLSEFQHMSYYLCLEKLKIYGGAFLFNSAGSGKIDIAAMIAKYFKDNDKKVLIIHAPGDQLKWKKVLNKTGLKEKDVDFISRAELYNSNFKYENFFGINLFIMVDADLLYHTKYKNNLRINFENLLKININSNSLFVSDRPFVSTFLDFTNNLKLLIKDNYLDKFKKDGIIRKINLLENDLNANRLTPEDITLMNLFLNCFSVNLKQKDMPVYFNKLSNTCFEKLIITQVKYAYDHEIFMRLYDRLIPFMNDLNFEYVKLWTKKVNDGECINYIKWKIYKRLETSIFSFRVCLREILEKNIEVKKILTSDADECKMLKKEHIENIKNNFAALEKNIQESALSNINKDISAIENFLLNVENIRYLENKDDKITNVLKILRNENKPTLIFSESKDTVLYIDRRLKEYGNFKTSVYYGNELSIEDQDQENCRDIEKDKLIEMFACGECDLFISTDINDEDINLSRAELIINFDVPVNPGTMLHRQNRLTNVSSKKIKIFNFFPDRRIDKETELIEKLNFKLEEALCFYGMDFVNWLTGQKKIDMSRSNFQEILRALNEFKEALSTASPENLQSESYLEDLNNNISLREFIKSYNISEDTIKFADTNYKKPVYTCFKADDNGYFSFYVHNGNIYTANRLVFSDIGYESELGNDEIENIKKLIVEQISAAGKNMNLLNLEDDEDLSEMPIGIIKYVKE